MSKESRGEVRWAGVEISATEVVTANLERYSRDLQAAHRAGAATPPLPPAPVQPIFVDAAGDSYALDTSGKAPRLVPHQRATRAGGAGSLDGFVPVPADPPTQSPAPAEDKPAAHSARHRSLVSQLIHDTAKGMAQSALSQAFNAAISGGGSSDVLAAMVGGGAGSLGGFVGAGIGQGIGMLMGEWKVDDNSPAAEQIAKGLVGQEVVPLAQEAVQNLALDLLGSGAGGSLGQIEQLQQILGLAPPPAGAPGFPAARNLDPTNHPGQVVATASRTLVNGRPTERVDDTHLCTIAIPPHNPGVVLGFSPTVFVEGRQTTMVTAPTSCGAAITSGSPNVLVGGPVATAPPPLFCVSAAARAAEIAKAGLNAQRIIPAAKPAGLSADEQIAELQKRAQEEGLGTLRVYEGRDPDAAMDKEPGIYLQEGGEYRIWYPQDSEGPPGWGSSIQEFRDLPDVPFIRDWFRVDDGPSLLNQVLSTLHLASPERKGGWYALFGILDLGSPERPGAGTGPTWWIPDALFGVDMRAYYTRHDWIFRPDSEEWRDRYVDQWLETELPAYEAGAASQGFNPLGQAFQVIYSFATTAAGLNRWSEAQRTVNWTPVSDYRKRIK